MDDAESGLHRSLRRAGEALVRELDGLAEHDRPFPERLPWAGAALGPDATGRVPWWPDGTVGLQPGNGNTAPGDTTRWQTHRRRVADAASAAARGKGIA